MQVRLVLHFISLYLFIYIDRQRSIYIYIKKSAKSSFPFIMTPYFLTGYFKEFENKLL